MMRLQRLGLEFFGHFTDKWLEFGDRPNGTSDFHLIYGSNEAGKTTLMEGYLRLLYGFRHIEPYDFKHNRPNLKVSATLEFEDGPRSFTRLPGRKNNLVDPSGMPLPETALQGALGGLTMEDYRNLLCLDDETIEAGGDEIANSKGDIGQLLFSAAAGVSDLTEVLEDVEKREAALYKKGGSKSEFAQLKHALEKVTAQIRDTDISASEYRTKRQTLTEALKTEQDIRAERREKLRIQTQLANIAKALPLVAQRKTLEQDLAPLANYPLDLDLDPEDLIKLSNRRGVLLAEIKRAQLEIDEKTAARDEIPPQPDSTQVLKKLDDLRDLRDRCGTAATDLPRRYRQRSEVLKDMNRRLVDIGLEAKNPADQFVFDLKHLRALDEMFQRVSLAKSAHMTSLEEEQNARQTHLRAQQAFEDATKNSPPRSDLQAVLDLHNAPRVLSEANRAEETVRLAQRAATEALSLLSFEGQVFDAVPQLPLQAQDASALARDIEAAKAALALAESEISVAQNAVEKRTAHLEALEALGPLSTDDDVLKTRHERDQLWQEHLADLAQPSAALFEAAMRQNDGAQAAHSNQAKERAEFRQLIGDLAQAQSDATAKKGALETSAARLAGLQAELERHLSTTGLKTSMSAGRFADWLQRAEFARDQARAAQNDSRAAQPFFAAAEALRKILASALEVPEAHLEALLVLAAKTASEQDKKRIELRAAQKTAEETKILLQRRSDKTAMAAAEQKEAEFAWTAALKAAFGAVGPDIPFPQAFETLREMRELNEKALGLAHQIDGMVADEQTLDGALAPLIKSTNDFTGLSTTDTYDALHRAAQACAASNARRDALLEEIQTIQTTLEASCKEQEDLDAQVQRAATVFESRIATGSLEEVREAVMRTKDAIDMRAQIARLSREVSLLLDLQSAEDIEAFLEGQTLLEVQTSENEVARDLVDLEAALTDAIECRTRAASALDAITGDADVATLVSRRQTLELEMESVIRRALELRIGHTMANTAIRRYRDTHRSGMMKAAEGAFAELTNGAYRGLTSQIDGAKETLVAIQSSDGAAKQAHSLSKGTRFQLYLALRAAAYEQMATNGTVLPFFCDDVFETFDEARTRAACGLMRRIGMTGQAVYLTHHQHVVDIAKEVCGGDVRIHEI